jgi:ferredoxin
MKRRAFINKCLSYAIQSGILFGFLKKAAAAPNGYDASKHYYGMGIQVDKCIGCGRCVEACKEENEVPPARKGKSLYRVLTPMLSI